MIAHTYLLFPIQSLTAASHLAPAEGRMRRKGQSSVTRPTLPGCLYTRMPTRLPLHTRQYEDPLVKELQNETLSKTNCSGWNCSIQLGCKLIHGEHPLGFSFLLDKAELRKYLPHGIIMRLQRARIPVTRGEIHMLATI